MEPTSGCRGFITARVPDSQVRAYCEGQLSGTHALGRWHFVFGALYDV
jgi:hypothetical protein